jgi:uncharacterized protein YndB with AHSA1/START domain
MQKIPLLPADLSTETYTLMAERKKFQLEYQINASPEFLFTYISSPSGLAEWFADNVNVNGEIFTFMWEGSEEKAKLIGKRTNKFVKFHWLDRPDSEYFLFEIEQDELTGDVALIVTDFEYDSELKGTTMIYDVSIEKLRGTIGG